MRTMLLLFAAAVLGLSAFSAWLFFGGPEDDPTRAKVSAHLAQIEALGPAARAGDAETQFALARLHHQDVFGEQDLGAAFQWYSKAAAQGHAGAQVALGALYAGGQGVKQDPYRAAEWYRVAATMGHNADAQLALGDLYFNGRGVPHDVAEARAWYRKAAERGHPVAQFLMGRLNQEGWAGRPDPVESYKWFTLALPGRALVLARDPALDPLKARDKVAQGMTEEQVARAKKAVRDWRPRR